MDGRATPSLSLQYCQNDDSSSPPTPRRTSPYSCTPRLLPRHPRGPARFSMALPNEFGMMTHESNPPQELGGNRSEPRPASPRPQPAHFVPVKSAQSPFPHGTGHCWHPDPCYPSSTIQDMPQNWPPSWCPSLLRSPFSSSHVYGCSDREQFSMAHQQTIAPGTCWHRRGANPTYSALRPPR